ncbi:OmpA family protein [Acidimangrovimonas sediminis]|uniref:OmpA family protein n=1 Tax=Acidimangrovimonas sediminis TaxID=2056283 RepID=UPI000C801DC9|nr:OmpA family protein [Acidimangrovimonas sediminis]
MRAAPGLAALFLLAAPGAQALTFDFPASAVLTDEQDSPMGSYSFPTAPFADGNLQTQRAEGPVSQRSWRIDQRDLTTLQVMAKLRDQILKAGFSPLFECATEACGGFDFRYALKILPEPQMHVDLADFRYLVARRGDKGTPKYLALLVSRSTDSAFVEVVQVGLPLPSGAAAAAAPSTASVADDAAAPATGQPAAPGSLAAALAAGDSVALDDLNFASGASDLSAGNYASLARLAAYMQSHPDQHITLVGNTDTTGGLAPNMALSKARAESVRQRLISQYSVEPDQISAEGIAYLAPRASNNTSEGRAQNRRVEAMVDSTQ